MRPMEIGLIDVRTIRRRVLDYCESGRIDEARETLKEAELEHPGLEATLNAEIQYRFGFKL